MTPRKKISNVDRFALFITNHVGSIYFFIAVFFWTAGWLIWNMLAPISLRFDPYPAFVLWLFISNMIQLFLMPLILIGQNLQSKKSEERAYKDLLIDKNSEIELKDIKKKVSEIRSMQLTIISLIDKKNKDDSTRINRTT